MKSKTELAGKLAIIDTSIILFIHNNEGPALIAKAVIEGLRRAGYKIVYPPVVKAELANFEERIRGKGSVYKTLNELAQKLPIYEHPRRLAQIRDRFHKFLNSLPECKRSDFKPLYCSVNSADIVISYIALRHDGILVTGDRGQACFHASLLGGKALLVPYEL